MANQSEFTLEDMVFLNGLNEFLRAHIRLGPIRLTADITPWGSVLIQNNPIEDSALTLRITIALREAGLKMVTARWSKTNETDKRRLSHLAALE